MLSCTSKQSDTISFWILHFNFSTHQLSVIRAKVSLYLPYSYTPQWQAYESSSNISLMKRFIWFFKDPCSRHDISYFDIVLILIALTTKGRMALSQISGANLLSWTVVNANRVLSADLVSNGSLDNLNNCHHGNGNLWWSLLWLMSV